MEVTDNIEAVIHAREYIPTSKLEPNRVKWIKIKVVNQYPQFLQGVCSYPFMFSPNFNFYVDVNYG